MVMVGVRVTRVLVGMGVEVKVAVVDGVEVAVGVKV
jgi:hypothetical protein